MPVVSRKSPAHLFCTWYAAATSSEQKKLLRSSTVLPAVPAYTTHIHDTLQRTISVGIRDWNIERNGKCVTNGPAGAVQSAVHMAFQYNPRGRGAAAVQRCDHTYLG